MLGAPVGRVGKLACTSNCMGIQYQRRPSNVRIPSPALPPLGYPRSHLAAPHLVVVLIGAIHRMH